MRFDYPIDDNKLTLSQIRGARPSPDGTRIVFTALDKLWIADLPQGRGVKKERPARRREERRPGRCRGRGDADARARPTHATSRDSQRAPPDDRR